MLMIFLSGFSYIKLIQYLLSGHRAIPRGWLLNMGSEVALQFITTSQEEFEYSLLKSPRGVSMGKRWSSFFLFWLENFSFSFLLMFSRLMEQEYSEERKRKSTQQALNIFSLQNIEN